MIISRVRILINSDKSIKRSTAHSDLHMMVRKSSLGDVRSSSVRSMTELQLTEQLFEWQTMKLKEFHHLNKK